jgi:hypothetical protein
MTRVTVAADHILRVLSQVMEVNDVAGIVITDPVMDEATGNWVRDLHIYRYPDEGATNATLILTVRLKGMEKVDIQIRAPGQDF